MAKIVEPIKITVEGLNGIFVASSSYQIGNGAPRVRLGTGITAAEAVSGLLAAFRRAGHAGKRFETAGFQPALRGSVPGWRKREEHGIENELPLVAANGLTWLGKARQGSARLGKGKARQDKKN